jgi:thiol-disulfide isomerase/thioredoxin
MNPNFDTLKGVVDCTLYRTQESEFGRRLESFIKEMCQLSQGKIRIVRASEDTGLPACPCFSISARGRAGIVYAALPAGFQFAPFLKALEWLTRDEPSGINPKVASIPSPTPAEIQVLISENCPHCPKVVEAAVFLAGRYPWISCCVIDAGQYPDIAQKYGVKSAPATIVDRRLVLVGSITADRLMELIEIRGTPKFEMEVVLSLIAGRRISEAAECLARDAGRQVILNLAQEPDFSKRLSALVVIEKALEDNPDAVRAMAPSFAALLGNQDARIRGDIADLLGKIGNSHTIEQLEPLTSDPDPDVAEIAAEAIDMLRTRFSVGGNEI